MSNGSGSHHRVLGQEGRGGPKGKSQCVDSRWPEAGGKDIGAEWTVPEAFRRRNRRSGLGAGRLGDLQGR